MRKLRRIVLHLMEYHGADELSLSEKIAAIKRGVPRGDFFSYIGKKNLGKDPGDISEYNQEEWRSTRYLIDECIEDGYLREEERDGEDYIFLTSEGKKLARKSYYYLKYLPETFSKPVDIIVTIGVSIVTTLVTIALTTHQ